MYSSYPWCVHLVFCCGTNKLKYDCAGIIKFVNYQELGTLLIWRCMDEWTRTCWSPCEINGSIAPVRHIWGELARVRRCSSEWLWCDTFEQVNSPRTTWLLNWTDALVSCWGLDPPLIHVSAGPTTYPRKRGTHHLSTRGTHLLAARRDERPCPSARRRPFIPFPQSFSSPAT